VAVESNRVAGPDEKVPLYALSVAHALNGLEQITVVGGATRASIYRRRAAPRQGAGNPDSGHGCPRWRGSGRQIERSKSSDRGGEGERQQSGQDQHESSHCPAAPSLPHCKSGDHGIWVGPPTSCAVILSARSLGTTSCPFTGIRSAV
jgi:hypothetical protein